MTPEQKSAYHTLATEIMEPVLNVAAKRLGQAIEEIHATFVQPLRDENERLRNVLHEIKRYNAQYNFGSKLVRLVDAALDHHMKGES